MVAASAAGLTLGSASRASAAAFGALPPGLVLPFAAAESVLEVFCVGGLSHWESFYAVEARGRSEGLQLHTYLGPMLAELESCGVSPPSPWQPLGVDALGAEVGLGPLAHALWSRDDLLARLRLVVLSHDVQPHEGAVPLALTGRPLGHRAAAGLGAHIQRFFVERDGASSGVPRSWVIGRNLFNAQAAVATGHHPGAARPLHVRDLRDLATAFARGPEDPALLDRLAAVVAAPLDIRHPRSRALADLNVARGILARAPAIAAFAASVGEAPPPAQHCGLDASSDTRRALHIAARLLSDPQRRVRHVCVLDHGLIRAPGGGGYDTHSDHARVQAANATHALGTLAALIARPGHGAPGLIDLDRTLVIIHSEFGRTPGPEGATGRDHHPYAYPIAMLGGPIAAGFGGIAGAIDEGGSAVMAATPAEARAAAMLALGIWPFAPEGFGVGDVPGAWDAIEGADAVARRFLGREIG